MLRELRKILRELLQTSGGGSYRPDRHYMRGPGPKWHAKYGRLAPKPTTAAGGGSVLAKMAEHRI